jgi:hypothetical protein
MQETEKRQKTTISCSDFLAAVNHEIGLEIN